MITNAMFRAAMGGRLYDTLRFENAWSGVLVMRVQDGDDTVCYEVSGDCKTTYFATLADAAHFALTELAKFEDGRCD